MNSTPDLAVLRIIPMTDREFRGFSRLIYQNLGIHISDHKRELLTARLSRRIRILGLKSFGDYLSLVEKDRAERTEMFDRIVTNETRFFREPGQFELLENEILPRWKEEAAQKKRAQRVRVWSAGCSTGQEPYSIAMTLLANLEGWEIEIVATDISTRALGQAADGTWPIEKSSEIPRALLERFMMKGVRSKEGAMMADDRLRLPLRFQRLNLHEVLPEMGDFDLIFWRNVLIDFDPESRTSAITRLLARLLPDGYFFLGHSESLLNSRHRLKSVAPSVYRWGSPLTVSAGRQAS